MSTAIVWFRNDLRLYDNPALFHAAQNHQQLILIYIIEPQLLGEAQYWWLDKSLESIQKSLEKIGASLLVAKADPSTLLPKLCQQYHCSDIYWNQRYEPKTLKADQKLKKHLENKGVHVRTYNASLLIEPWEIQNKSEQYFKVFTPFWKAAQPIIHIPSPLPVPQLKTISIKDHSIRATCPKPNWPHRFNQHWSPGELNAQKQLNDFLEHDVSDYEIQRNIPSLQATSKLSPHLHFGEISPQIIWREIQTLPQNKDNVQTFLAELGWREFSYHLLHHFPDLPNKNFKSSFNRFTWLNTKHSLKAWQQGQTGYPIVDAGMRELWQTGYMHNRVRMITASFLTKHLLIDWRRGAQWFYSTLLDANLANNSFNWQWVAGCGADAAPYFRIFNPTTQGEKFDPRGLYVKYWCPELSEVSPQWIHRPWEAKDINLNYPPPIIDHSTARTRALEHYQATK